jgi:Na+/citrate or Na+/malate symporter
VIWSIIGVLVGLIGGYFLWNAMLYVTIELIRGGGAAQSGPLRSFYRDRFDLRASWGILFLATSLALLVAAKAFGTKSPAGQDPERAAPSDSKEEGQTQ